ncbi:MAG: DUF1109 domain-containing protein [Pseudomonadota bacterium]
MKTDSLISALSEDTLLNQRVDGVLPWILAASTLVFGGGYLLLAGVRPDIGEALQHLNVLIKQVFPLILAATALGLVMNLSRPGERPGVWPWVLMVVPAILIFAVVTQLLVLPAAAWGPAFIGHSISVCLTMIPLISAPILAGSLYILRRGAPTHPGLCGAVAGLMSSGAAATAYAFFCTDDSPLFYSTWYSVGIGAMTLVGFLLGRQFLRW